MERAGLFRRAVPAAASRLSATTPEMRFRHHRDHRDNGGREP
jgi:hypothetical protein